MKHSITYGPRTSGEEIVSLDMAKANAKIEYNDEDELFQLFLDGISDEIEHFTGRKFIEREVEILFNAIDKKIDLPTSISSIENIYFFDENGDETLLVEDIDFKFFSYNNGTSQRILFLTLDSIKLQDLEDNEFPLKITAKVGYTTENMPADIKRAALLMFNNAEAYREDMPVHLNRSAQAILRPHKIY